VGPYRATGVEPHASEQRGHPQGPEDEPDRPTDEPDDGARENRGEARLASSARNPHGDEKLDPVPGEHDRDPDEQDRPGEETPDVAAEKRGRNRGWRHPGNDRPTHPPGARVGG